MRWDLSALRPWEFWQTDAREWTQAEQAMSEYRKGLADAEDEQRAREELG